jgi:hypothetical protein
VGESASSSLDWDCELTQRTHQGRRFPEWNKPAAASSGKFLKAEALDRLLDNFPKTGRFPEQAVCEKALE